MCYDNIHNVIPRKRDSTVDARCYELSWHEKESLNQIEEYLKKGYKDPSMQKEHAEYVVHLLQRLLGILENERSVGAPIESLEMDIERVRSIFQKLKNI